MTDLKAELAKRLAAAKQSRHKADPLEDAFFIASNERFVVCKLSATGKFAVTERITNLKHGEFDTEIQALDYTGMGY